MGRDDEDLRAALLAAESDADSRFSTATVGEAVLPCQRGLHWVEFTLFEEGAPASELRFRLTLPGGRIEEGALNARGRVRVDRIAESGECSITFPEVDDVVLGQGLGASDDEAPGDDATAEGRVYVPGRVVLLPLDAVHRFDLPDWELVELDAEGVPEEGEGGAAGEEVEGDWDLESLDLTEPEGE